MVLRVLEQDSQVAVLPRRGVSVRRRWTRSSRLYLAGSVCAAVLAGLLVHGGLEGVGSASAGAGPQVAVVVAGQDVSRGTPLQPSALHVVRIPSAFAPPGAVSGIRQAAGRVALTDLAHGEVVTQTRLARVRAGPVASLVPQGLRAFAVPTSLPSGSVAAGDRVDVLGTFGAGGAGQPHTETVVEGVEVLLVLGDRDPAIGGGSALGLDASAAGAGSTVTLIVLVGPDDEERLAYARAFANLEVAIAPPGAG
jgi:Flp pilus assembly protein CpaB